MDTQKQSSELIIAQIAPAQLWVGQHELLMQQLIPYLQKVWCLRAACGTCSSCRSVSERQHHGITWLTPEKQYTLEQITIIQETIAYALEHNQHHFFIIEKAEALSPSCSNSLLKSVEEPPMGYHFIFLTDHPSVILPTIKSRCIMRTFNTTEQVIQEDPLFLFFSRESTMAPSTFLKLLEKHTPHERITAALLDHLLAHWITQYKDALLHNKSSKAHAAEKIINTLRTAMQQPPMAGGSKLFWKNLFLQIKE